MALTSVRARARRSAPRLAGADAAARTESKSTFCFLWLLTQYSVDIQGHKRQTHKQRDFDKTPLHLLIFFYEPLEQGERHGSEHSTRNQAPRLPRR